MKNLKFLHGKLILKLIKMKIMKKKSEILIKFYNDFKTFFSIQILQIF